MWVTERVTSLARGDWTFELADDEVSRIRFRGVDVLRGVRAVARDRDWATPRWAIGPVEETPSGARLALETTELGMHLRGSLAVRAGADSLEIAFEATAERDVFTNRTGLVVLHPPRLAGSPLRVTHSDSASEDAAFPTRIAPHQPALDITALDWEHDGLAVSCRFAGDVFEMEDQRNWTDASFKTYSRPLSLPFPYAIARGEVVRQSVTVTIADAAAPERARPGTTTADPETVTLEHAGTMPAVSVGASTAAGSGPAPDPLGAGLLVELDLGWRGWPAALRRAGSSGLPLDVRLVLPEHDARDRLDAATAALDAHKVARIAAFQPAGHDAQHVSDAEATRLLRDALARHGRRLAVVGGARSHFTELNREHARLPRDLDGVVFSTTPLFHTRETRQLEEAVAIQRLVALQAVRIAAGAPVHVGPVTLRPHVNNVATTAPPRPSTDGLEEGYGPALLDADDARQAAPELAAWTIASAAALSAPGVATISFFEEWGPRGIRTVAGEDLPVAGAVRALASLAGRLLTIGRSDDDRVWILRAGETVLAASLADNERVVSVEGLAPLPLPPRSWRRIDVPDQP